MRRSVFVLEDSMFSVADRSVFLELRAAMRFVALWLTAAFAAVVEVEAILSAFAVGLAGWFQLRTAFLHE